MLLSLGFLLIAGFIMILNNTFLQEINMMGGCIINMFITPGSIWYSYHLDWMY